MSETAILSHVIHPAAEHGHQLPFQRTDGNISFDIADAGTRRHLDVTRARAQAGQRSAERVEAILLSLAAPTRLRHRDGRRDRLVPIADSGELARLILGAEFGLMPGAHLAVLRAKPVAYAARTEAFTCALGRSQTTCGTERPKRIDNGQPAIIEAVDQRCWCASPAPSLGGSRPTRRGCAQNTPRATVHVAREDLGTDGTDQDGIDRYPERIAENPIGTPAALRGGPDAATRGRSARPPRSPPPHRAR